MSHVLGKQSAYPEVYTPEILASVPRALGRSKLAYDATKCAGNDIWTLYELSHLDLNGVPKNYIGILTYSDRSEAIVESKSLKLYLNGFNTIKMSYEDFYKHIILDVSKTVKADVSVQLFQLNQLAKIDTHFEAFHCIDTISDFKRTEALQKRSIKSEQLLYTDAFRSRCPVTGQPDWASIYVAIDGEFGIDEQSFLTHIIDIRDHQAFHEQCVEELLTDLRTLLPKSTISIFARFTRRGGIDINPYRYYGHENLSMKKLVQQSQVLRFRHSRQ
jgi:7-cyano-7-deazaguanine reductase